MSTKVHKDVAGREVNVGDRVVYFPRSGSGSVGTLERISDKGNPTIRLDRLGNRKVVRRKRDGREFLASDRRCYAIAPYKTYIHRETGVRITEAEYNALPSRAMRWDYAARGYVPQSNEPVARQDYRCDYDGVLDLEFEFVTIEVPLFTVGQLGSGRLVLVEAAK